ncbi:MAG: hypothetical protein ACOX5K_03495 [Bacteroidales bacterium]|jgi:hypothetical protein
MKIRNIVLLLVGGLFLLTNCSEPANNELFHDDNVVALSSIKRESDSYIYPVRPGSPEWNNFENHEQMVEACQIPKSVLNIMSTKGVIESILENPLYGDFAAYNNYQEFYDRFSSTFNAYKTLESRADASSELISKYCSMEYQYSNLSGFSYWDGRGCVPGVAFLCMEILLAQDFCLDKATNKEIKSLSLHLYDSYKLRGTDDNPKALFLEIGRFSAAWVASRIMEKQQYGEWLVLKNGRDAVSNFLRTGMFCDERESIIEVFEHFIDENCR